jgi:hypothetical protein
MAHRHQRSSEPADSSAPDAAAAATGMQAPRDPVVRARRRAEVLRMLSRQRRRQARREPSSYRWPGTESA